MVPMDATGQSLPIKDVIEKLVVDLAPGNGEIRGHHAV